MLTEGRRIDFVYTQNGNHTLEFYRISTDTDIGWFDPDTGHQIVTVFYTDRIIFTRGNITLLNIVCDDTGVYNLLISTQTGTSIKEFNVYPSRSCLSYYIYGTEGSLVWLLPFVTTKNSVWTYNNRTIHTLEFTIQSLNKKYTNKLGFSDMYDTMSIGIGPLGVPYKVVVTCDLTSYRWYYRNMKVVNSRLFTINIQKNTIAGYDTNISSYECRPLQKRHHWVSLCGIALLFVSCVICCMIIIWTCITNGENK